MALIADLLVANATLQRSSSAARATKDFAAAVAKWAQDVEARAPQPAPTPAPYESIDFDNGIPSPWSTTDGAAFFSPLGVSFGVVADPLGQQGQVLRLNADYDATIPTDYTHGALQQTAVFLNPPYAHAGQLPDGTLAANMETWYSLRFMAPADNRFPLGEGPPLVGWHDTTSGAGPKSSVMMCYSGYPLAPSGTTAPPKLIFRNTLVNSDGSPAFQFFPGNTPDENAAVAQAPTFTLGVWHSALFHYVWSTDPARGLVEWWLDGVRYASTHMQTQTAGDYYSFGVYCYRYNITATTTFYYDALRVGPTRESVTP